MRIGLRRTLLAILWLAIAGLGTATACSLLGRFHWTLDLFSHFRLQYGLGLAAVGAVAVVLRSKLPALLSLTLLLPNLVALSYYFPSRQAPDSAPDFSLLSFNVLTSNRSHAEALAYLQARDPDLIFLMETSQAWIRSLDSLRQTHPHVIEHPLSNNFGFALFSRFPIEKHTVRTFRNARVPALEAHLEIEGRSVTFLGAHPPPPMGRSSSLARNAYLTELGKLAAQSSQPLIVAGDFNATPWSPYFRDFVSAAALSDSGRRRGFQATWHRSSPLFSIPIDHILHSPDLRSTERQIGPDLGSDHRPVLVSFSLPPTPQAP